MDPPEDAWGVGCYEDTAAELAPVAEVAVGALGLVGGERVLDVACGTGNAAAVAAAAGARVSGLDGSARLLEVARERVPDGEFVRGDAAAMPFEDGAFDAAVSVSGVIFVRPAEQAATEMARVVHPGGRVVVTSWVTSGPWFAALVLMREAVARVRPPDGPSPGDWGDRATLERLLGPYGELEITERVLSGRPLSAEAFWDRWERLHPIWIRARRLLEPAGEWERVREDAKAVLREGMAQHGSDQPYLLTVLRRS